MMKKFNRYIGFDDRLVTIILIPVAAIIIPFIFYDRRFTRAPFFTFEIFTTSLIITTFIWVGNRYIMYWARKKYYGFEKTKKRLWIQSITMFVFTIFASNILDFILKDYCLMLPKEVTYNEIIDAKISGNAAALLCTLTVIAIYESIYFVNQLKTSIEEREHLKRETLNAQFDALKTQVNPHFLFNNLNTLTSLIPEDKDHAITFVKELSKVYRHILEVNDEKTITLAKELEVVNAYAFLLKTRFNNNLNIAVNLDNSLLQKQIVPLSLQMLIENAIKHNITTANNPLTITIRSDGDYIIVSNNLQIKKQVIASTGIGLENIENRYKMLTSKKISIRKTEEVFEVAIPVL